MNKKSSKRLITFGFVGLTIFLSLSIGVTSCVNQESKGLIPDYPYTSLTPSISTEDKETSSQLSSSINEELPVPEEEQIDIKKSNFTFTKNIESEMIEDLFKRMFDDAITHHDTPDLLGYCVDDDENNFHYDNSYQLFHKTGIFKCPTCNKINKYLVTMNYQGLIEYYIFNHCTHLPDNDEYLYINLAKSFANYLNKENSVLVGANYKYDFGLIKKGDIYYFEFLGLNIPVITKRLDNYYYTMLDSMDVRVEFNVQGDSNFDLEKKENFETKNLIPLMFYKHFANICIDYELTPKSSFLKTKALEDLNNNTLDNNFVPEDKKNDLESYKNELVKDKYKYKLSFENGLKIVDECFINIFKNQNPAYQNTDNYYIDENNHFIINNGLEYCEESFGTISSKQIIGDYKYDVTKNKYIELEEIFPFFNNFSLVPGWCHPQIEKPEGYVNGDGIVNFANSIGDIATLGCYQGSTSLTDMLHAMDPEVYKDFSNYHYSIGLTDAYFEELEFYIEKGLFKHCALNYVNALLGGEENVTL